uniref:Very low-density lipoprotein receptor n=2 Tax=Lygus hesperus TaxID=30085 RepID=A0A146M5B0_LYGHE
MHDPNPACLAVVACIGCSLAAQIPQAYDLKPQRQPSKTVKSPKLSGASILWTSTRDSRIVLPLDNPTVDSVEATLSWENMARGERLGSSFVLKKGEKFMEYAVLYKPRDSSFVVRGLLDATGYMGELKVLRNKEALADINSTNTKDSTVFKLDTPRIISGSESEMILSVLTTLPPSMVRLDSVSVGFKIPKQKEDSVLEVSDLARNDTGKAVIHVVPNTVSVVVNDLPAQTVVKIAMKKTGAKSSNKPINTMYLFTGSVTNIVENVPQVTATSTRLGLLKNVQRRPTVTCYVKNKPPFQGFPCHNSNVCIPLHWECDGEEDCDGGFDESGCQGGLSAYTRQYINRPNNFQLSGRCKRGEFECLSRGVNVCLPTNWLCDGRRDCTNGWDENQANCNANGWGFPNSGNNYHLVNNLQCGRSQYRCRKGGCVSMRMLCDGRDDCRDGSDEDDCPEDEGSDIDEEVYADNCDPDHEYVCSGPRKKCVPRPWVCDDEDDCPGGEDESDDLCNNHFHNFND